MADETVIIKMMDSPEDVKLQVGNLSRKVSVLEEKVEDIESVQKPIRWIFNKVAAGMGLAVAAAILAWLGLDL